MISPLHGEFKYAKIFAKFKKKTIFLFKDNLKCANSL